MREGETNEWSGLWPDDLRRDRCGREIEAGRGRCSLGWRAESVWDGGLATSEMVLGGFVNFGGTR